MGIYLGVNNIARAVPRIYVGKSNEARRVTKIYKGVNGKARQIYEYIDEREYAVKFSSDGNFELSPSQGLSNFNLEFSINEGLTQTRQRGDASSPIPLTGTSSQPIYLRGTGNTVLGSLNMPQHFTGKYVDGNLENLLDYQTVKAGGHPTMGQRCFISMFENCTTLERAANLYADESVAECCSNMYKGCANLLKIPDIGFLFLNPHGATLTASCCTQMFMNCSSLNGFATTTLRGFHIAFNNGSYCLAQMFNGCTSLTSMKPIYIYNTGTTTGGEYFRQMFKDCTSLVYPPIIRSNTSSDLTDFNHLNMFNQMFSGCSTLKVREIVNSTATDTTIIRIPSNATTVSSSFTEMFKNTGGEFTGTPRAGYKYDFYI